jgi:hypothetical protein
MRKNADACPLCGCLVSEAAPLERWAEASASERDYVEKCRCVNCGHEWYNRFRFVESIEGTCGIARFPSDSRGPR